jgi:hypothetical protein
VAGLKGGGRAADKKVMAARRKTHTNTQRFAREKFRLVCEVLVLGERHSGIVTDLSASGLFVRTSKIPPQGTTLHVRIDQEGGDPIEIDARVIRTHKASLHHTTEVPRGLGLHIVSAPESYFHFLAALTEKKATA